MLLIGMFDSPFVRRVAVSMQILEMPYEHRNWSVGKDFESIRRFNPLGRVPTLVLDDGTSLVESAAILDWLDDQVGSKRALLPPSGDARRDALQLMALAHGAAEKGVLQIYERAFRPEDKRHAPWVARCQTQMHSALGVLEEAAAARAGQYLVGEKLSQADVTVACVQRFLHDALGVNGEATEYTALAELAAGCERLAAFAAVPVEPFFAPG
jgi:glutathione S-transferase